MTEPTTAMALPACARCGDPIAAPYPTRIVGEPYHAACARSEEAERMHLIVCQRCASLVGPDEAVLTHGDATGIYCLGCWAVHYPHEDATLMSVLIAEQNRSGEE